MSQPKSACWRCGERHILDGARCVRCRQDSERHLDLVEGCRSFSRVLVWFELDAWARYRAVQRAEAIGGTRAAQLLITLTHGNRLALVFV